MSLPLVGSTRVWTLEEIQSQTNTGDWFYGVIWDGKRLRVGEILPGLGYVVTLPYPWWSPRSWWWLLKDVYRAKPCYVSATAASEGSNTP